MQPVEIIKGADAIREKAKAYLPEGLEILKKVASNPQAAHLKPRAESLYRTYIELNNIYVSHKNQEHLLWGVGSTYLGRLKTWIGNVRELRAKVEAQVVPIKQEKPILQFRATQTGHTRT